MISQEKIKKIKKLLKDFWVKYESKIALTIGMILVAILAFEAGILHGQNFQQKPLIIEKPAESVSQTAEASTAQNTLSQAQNSAPEAPKNAEAGITIPQNCAFVGSKNSNKYHLPTCRWAKQIKPENLVCFSSTEDAQSKGYQPDSNCIK